MGSVLSKSKFLALTLRMLALATLIGAMNAKAAPAEANLGLEEAESLASEMQAFAEKRVLRGKIEREATPSDPLFDAADRIVSAYINGAIRVERIEASESNVRFAVRDLVHGLHFVLNSKVENIEIEVSEKGSVQSPIKRIFPAMQLIVEEGTQWFNKRNGTFVSVTRSVMGPDGNVRVEAGQTKGPFTLTVFGATSGNNIRLGTSQTLRLYNKNGLSINLRAEQSAGASSSLNMVEGTYDFTQVLSLNIRKSFSGDMFYVSGGAVFKWTQTSGNSNSNSLVYVGAGRKFKNKRGQEVGSVDIVGSMNLGVSEAEWFVGIRASFKF